MPSRAHIYPWGSHSDLATLCLSDTHALCLFFSHKSFQDHFILSEYEILTAVTKGNQTTGNNPFGSVTLYVKRRWKVPPLVMGGHDRCDLEPLSDVVPSRRHASNTSFPLFLVTYTSIPRPLDSLQIRSSPCDSLFTQVTEAEKPSTKSAESSIGSYLAEP